MYYLLLHKKTHFLYFAHFSLAIMTGYFHEYKSIFKSGEIGRIRDNLPVREVVGELTVRYQISIEYKSYFYGFQRNAFPPKCFSTKGFSTKCFPRNAGKSRWGKSKDASVTHYFCGLIARKQLLDISAD